MTERNRGYSKAELRNLRPDADPDRGTFCQRCHQIVPEFTDLTAADVRLLRDLIADDKPLKAITFIQERTECPLRWAKLWVNHPYGGAAISQRPTPPCPICGSQLRTPTARQCPRCFHTWHEQ